MADQLYFSRDTKVFIKIGTTVWEVPVLDGFSFSQATNASEVTLSEMSGTGGSSRRGRRMFTDSFAPAEWSFSTYMRPFTTVGAAATGSGETAQTAVQNQLTGKLAGITDGDHHAVEEVLWALLAGPAHYQGYEFKNAADRLGLIDNFCKFFIALYKLSDIFKSFKYLFSPSFSLLYPLGDRTKSFAYKV